jgi:hypothetical protein
MKEHLGVSWIISDKNLQTVARSAARITDVQTLLSVPECCWSKIRIEQYGAALVGEVVQAITAIGTHTHDRPSQRRSVTPQGSSQPRSPRTPTAHRSQRSSRTPEFQSSQASVSGGLTWMRSQSAAKFTPAGSQLVSQSPFRPETPDQPETLPEMPSQAETLPETTTERKTIGLQEVSR